MSSIKDRICINNIILSVLIILACVSFTANAAMVDENLIPIHQVNSKVCEDCHQEIYMQWRGSMHAQSVALKDPIHAAFYKQVIGDPRKENVRSASGKYPVCLQCHAPSAARDKKSKLDSKVAYKQGVNCVSCHALKTYKGIEADNGKWNLGIKAYELSDKLQGSNGFFKEQGKAAERLRAKLNEQNDTNPHLGRDDNNVPYLSEADVKLLDLPLQANSILKTSAACLGCHDRRNNSHGVPLCATGDEMRAGKSQASCQSCHMPIVDGRVSHEMGGGHDIAMLKRSLRLDINTKKSAGVLSVDVILENLQPHDVPTGAPFRNAYLKLTAVDNKGNIIWENFKVHPIKEDPKAYFSYTLTDEKGKPAPPPKATNKGENTRLKPYETRVLNYTMALENVHRVRAEVYYNLLWKSLLDNKFKQLEPELKAPKKIAWREVKIN